MAKPVARMPPAGEPTAALLPAGEVPLGARARLPDPPTTAREDACLGAGGAFTRVARLEVREV